MDRNVTRVLVISIGILLLAACGGGSEQPADAAPSNAAAIAAESQTASVDPAAQIAHGKQIFQSTCAACHGETGKGDGPGSAALDPKPRDFSNDEYMSGLTDTEIRNTIKYGGAIKGMPQMPSHPQFSEEDLNAVVAYVRTLHK